MNMMPKRQEGNSVKSFTNNSKFNCLKVITRIRLRAAKESRKNKLKNNLVNYWTKSVTHQVKGTSQKVALSHLF